jgi:hydroxypyruvate reductase/glycerate 2-kinase
MRQEAREIWEAGVRAAHAGTLVRRAIRVEASGISIGDRRIRLLGPTRVLVVGAGKAGGAMARAAEDRLRGLPEMVAVSGWINVPGGPGDPVRGIVLHAARSSHDNRPTPAGVAGTRKILEAVAPLGPRDLVINLVSGGGSALTPAPAGRVTLADKKRVTDLLHTAGATINDLNAVRKHLSDFKGGGLARATRAQVATLLVSDVVGDPLDVIASGPTAADPTTYADALAILDRYGLRDRVPRRVLRHLREGRAGRHPETLKRIPARVTHHLLGNNATARRAAARRARVLGYRVVDLGSFWEGESREIGGVLAGLARSVRDEGVPARAPVCLLAGGESTVTLGKNPGRGGRAQEVALGALVHLAGDGLRGIGLLSGGTDGEDGPTDAAGAWVDAGVLRRAGRLGLDPDRALAAHDAYAFFAGSGGLLHTGPTHTNVMDLMVVLVRGGAGRRSGKGRGARSRG